MPSLAQVLLRPRKAVPAIASGIASCAGADLTLSDLAADVVLRAVGVRGDFGPVEHHEQLAFVGMEPFEQPVESDEASVSGEDAVQAGAQRSLALLAGVLAIGLEIAI